MQKLAAMFAAAGLSSGEMTAGQRAARGEYRMKHSQVRCSSSLSPVSGGKPKKKPFGAPTLTRRQRKGQTSKTQRS